jgi:hypothetical protein
MSGYLDLWYQSAPPSGNSLGHILNRGPDHQSNYIICRNSSSVGCEQARNVRAYGAQLAWYKENGR